jgi:signal transduction histidine kinase
MHVIEDANLTRREIYELFQIALSSVASARHALNNALGAVLALTELAKISPKSDTDISPFLLQIERSARAAGLIVEASLDFWPSPDMKYDPFVVQPSALIQLISSNCHGANIILEESARTTLSLIYPVPALFIAIHELIGNAVRHSGNSVQVIVSWRMRNERFVCTVDDSGPGLCKDLTDSYLPSDALDISTRPNRGVRLVRAILDSSRGLLLFRRSDILKGTQVLLEFPVVGYYAGEDLIRFSHVYKD